MLAVHCTPLTSWCSRFAALFEICRSHTGLCTTAASAPVIQYILRERRERSGAEGAEGAEGAKGSGGSGGSGENASESRVSMCL